MPRGFGMAAGLPSATWNVPRSANCHRPIQGRLHRTISACNRSHTISWSFGVGWGKGRGRDVAEQYCHVPGRKVYADVGTCRGRVSGGESFQADRRTHTDRHIHTQRQTLMLGRLSTGETLQTGTQTHTQERFQTDKQTRTQRKTRTLGRLNTDENFQREREREREKRTHTHAGRR